MWKSIKKSLLIGITCGSLVFCYGCVETKTNDYHESNDRAWLIEQVEKGNLTQAEADAIWARQQQVQKQKAQPAQQQ